MQKNVTVGWQGMSLQVPRSPLSASARLRGKRQSHTMEHWGNNEERSQLCWTFY